MIESEMDWTPESLENTENNATNETSYSLNDDILFDIMSYLTIIDRIALLRVCHNWKTVIEKSFKSVSVLDGSTVLGQMSDLRIPETAMALIIRMCPNVKHLDLNGIDLFESKSDKEEDDSKKNIIVETIAKNCYNLQTIDFSFLDNSAFHKVEEQFISFATYFSQLKKIVSKHITDSALNCFIDSENLECIDISCNLSMDSPEFKRLGQNIREMYLLYSGVFEEPVIKELCEGNGKLLTKLSIDIIDVRVLSNVCAFLKNLTFIELNICVENCDFTQFSNLSSLQTLIIHLNKTKCETHEFTGLVRSLKKVKLLELEISPSQDNLNAITDDSLQNLRESCETLEKLVLRDANSLTSHGMYAISQMQNLKHIDFMDCLNIGDGIDIVITSCPLLRHLNLHNCSRISVVTVDAFIEKAKKEPKEQFTLDVINTIVEQDFEREIPANMRLLFKNKDCHYDCHCFHDNEEDDEFGDSDDLVSID